MTTKLLIPVPITDAMYTGGSVYETAPAAWGSGTNYALGADASVAGAAGLITVYRSLQASNTNHAPASSPLWWKVLCVTYAPYSGGTTYALYDHVIDATAHRVYESRVGSNLGNPLSDKTKWLDIGPTNRWAAFDRKVGTTSTINGPLTVVLEPGQIGGLALIELVDASSFQATLRSPPGGTVVWTADIDLNAIDILDWWDFFFADFELRTEAQVTDIPPYEDGELTIEINGSGEVGCGVVAVGPVHEIGSPQYGAELGFIDFSRKEADQFGVLDIAERGYANRMDLQIICEPGALSRTRRLLASVRAKFSVWIGVDEEGFEATVLYGFPRDFRMVIAYPSYHLCNLQIESVI